MIRAELDRAKALLAEATDLRARDALTGVVMALEWAYEDGGRNGPSVEAAKVTTDPLDRDFDGVRGGSQKRGGRKAK